MLLPDNFAGKYKTLCCPLPPDTICILYRYSGEFSRIFRVF